MQQKLSGEEGKYDPWKHNQETINWDVVGGGIILYVVLERLFLECYIHWSWWPHSWKDVGNLQEVQKKSTWRFREFALHY